MKKTLASMLIGSAIMAASASTAFADTSGTMTFTGTVADTTCTVSDLNQSIVFSNYDRTTFQNSVVHTAYEVQPVNYQVSGCPANITNARLNVSFTNGDRSPERLSLGNTDARGLAVLISKEPVTAGSTAPPSTLYSANSSNKDFPIDNGSGVVSLYPLTMRVNSSYLGQATVVAGDFTTSANVELTFN
ncbi:fimbrial protein [Pantoea sp. SO10]|uniref:fimbrial protein n=1 Tax=Pantoea sp. SO10 TaxID=2575375 RepID=UPI0010C987DE|nr:fimbrial protein [Pantoea sp. SO10]QCP60195.1 type 1 fimbrial protein [Pantoea sp. SO10]